LKFKNEESTFEYRFLAYFYILKNVKYTYEIMLLSAVCVCLSPHIVARQWLGKNPPIVARQWLDKNPPTVAKQWLGSVKIPLSLLGNGLVETLPW
jgi:hypothetical protein